jgi:D-alanyl-D-alanine dipeptidase
MKKSEIYYDLESKMLGFSDLISIPVTPNGEVMTAIAETQNLTVSPIDPEMIRYTGDSIFVRQTVAALLGSASLLLAERDESLQLNVVYGYRALDIQIKKFEKFKAELSSKYEDVELLEAVHRLIAVPEVSGHPTGGAVDLQICRDGKPLDFGTKIWEFDRKSYTFSPDIAGNAMENRLLLRECLLEVGFAPFDGEWWHFSYGDREWAKYYNRPPAIYEQIDLSNFSQNN